MKDDLKVWCQQHHSECLAQLAVYEARELAGAALLALSDKKLEKATAVTCK